MDDGEARLGMARDRGGGTADSKGLRLGSQVDWRGFLQLMRTMHWREMKRGAGGFDDIDDGEAGRCVAGRRGTLQTLQTLRPVGEVTGRSFMGSFPVGLLWHKKLIFQEGMTDTNSHK